MVESAKFDIFLAHNSVDKPQVRAIAEQLRRHGLKPWLDEEQIIGGDSIPRKVKEGLIQSPVAAFIIGTSGFGKFQKTWELDVLIMLCYQNNVRIIPILLPGVDTLPNELVLFKGIRYLEFCQSVDEIEPLKDLVKAITTTVQPLTPKRRLPSLQVFKFDIVTVQVESRLLGLSSKVTFNRSHSQARHFTENLGNDISLDMVAIPGGKFLMGKGRTDQHKVTVQPFFMGKYPVTQAQWKAISSLPKIERDLELEPSHFKGDDRPVEQVSWFDVVEFCQRLSRQTEQGYRLPTEAEWEHACRAGTITPFYFGDTIITDLANYDGRVAYGNYFVNGLRGEYRGQTTPVGIFPPNDFGLYDMHGNVWEWCEDNFHHDYEGAPTDGSAWYSEKYISKVVRGGSWMHNPSRCTSSGSRKPFPRDSRYDSLGFRVVCDDFRNK